jgi:hypothetical protein
MMFPDGNRHAPPKVVGACVFGDGTERFDDTEVNGLIMIMFEFIGVPITFPFGASVRLLKPSVPTNMFEDPRPTGSN